MEKEMFAFIQGCLQPCVDVALKDIFKDWK